MKFSNSDRIFFAGVLITISTFSLLLYSDFTKKIDTDETEMIGEIAFKRRTAQRKYFAHVVWEDLSRNEPLYNKDTIRTAKLSDVIIRLNDGTMIELDENSMILLALSDEAINIDFSYGSIFTKRGNVDSNDAKNLNIKAENSIVSIKKSDINLSIAEDQSLNLSVSKGNASIRTEKEEKSVDEDQKVLITKDTGEVEIFRLNLKLLIPSQNAYFITETKSKDVDFSWSPLEDIHNINFEISKDPDFNNTFIKRNITTNSTTATIPEGSYYWRLRSLQKDLQKIYISETRKFTVIKDELIKPISPDYDQVFSYRNYTPLINFKWSKSNIATGYIVELARDDALKRIINRLESDLNTIAIDSLGKGTYYWRVRAKIALTGITYSTPSPVYRFAIIEKDYTQPPELLSPEKNINISHIILKKRHIMFTWMINPEILESKLFISNDKSFNKIIFTGVTRKNFFYYSEDITPGRYYWRVAGICKDGFSTDFSVTRSFNLIKEGNIELISPRDKAIIVQDDNGSLSINFSWKRTDFEPRFKLQLSDDKSFQNIYRESTTDAYSLLMYDIKPGRYFWRTKLLQSDGSNLMTSSPNILYIRDRLKEPIPLEPADGTVINMQDKDYLKFAWMELEGANLYEFKLYQTGHKKSPIIVKRTNATNYKLHELRLLDRGKFYWTLQSFEMDKNNQIIRKSTPVNNDFTITLGKPLKRLEEFSPKIIYTE